MEQNKKIITIEQILSEYPQKKNPFNGNDENVMLVKDVMNVKKES